MCLNHGIDDFVPSSDSTIRMLNRRKVGWGSDQTRKQACFSDEELIRFLLEEVL
jgi:hypothetical protein